MKLSKFDLQKKVSFAEMKMIKVGCACSSKSAATSTTLGDSDTGESDSD